MHFHSVFQQKSFSVHFLLFFFKGIMPNGLLPKPGDENGLFRKVLLQALVSDEVFNPFFQLFQPKNMAFLTILGVDQNRKSILTKLSFKEYSFAKDRLQIRGSKYSISFEFFFNLIFVFGQFSCKLDLNPNPKS